MLPDVEVAVTAMVRRWQCELLDVQQKYGFELVEDMAVDYLEFTQVIYFILEVLRGASNIRV